MLTTSSYGRTCTTCHPPFAAHRPDDLTGAGAGQGSRRPSRAPAPPRRRDDAWPPALAMHRAAVGLRRLIDRTADEVGESSPRWRARRRLIRRRLGGRARSGARTPARARRRFGVARRQLVGGWAGTRCWTVGPRPAVGDRRTTSSGRPAGRLRPPGACWRSSSVICSPLAARNCSLPWPWIIAVRQAAGGLPSIVPVVGSIELSAAAERLHHVLRAGRPSPPTNPPSLRCSVLSTASHELRARAATTAVAAARARFTAPKLSVSPRPDPAAIAPSVPAGAGTRRGTRPGRDAAGSARPAGGRPPCRWRRGRGAAGGSSG